MYDCLIRGGLIADGTGAPLFRGDVALRDGKIAGIGDFFHDRAEKIIDAGGLVVAPGFFDAHAHSDTGFLSDTSCASKLYQGITTEVTGQCGSSPFPTGADASDPWQCPSFQDFLDKFRREGPGMATHQAMLCGHGDLRAAVMGYQDRPATDAEIEGMRALLARDLAAGAWGLSLGLEYAPGVFADRRELAALAAVVRQFDGVVTCHMRSEGLQIEAAIDELAEAGRQSGAHVHISHLKIDHFSRHGQAEKIWEKIEDIRRGGVQLTCDLYPYTASCTSLSIRCPAWSREGGSQALVKRLQGEERQQIVEGIRAHYFNARRAETCLINSDGGLWPQIVGKTLRQVAEEELHTRDYADAAAQVLIRTQGKAGCIFFVMDEGDMLHFLSKNIGIGSDGWALSGDEKKVDGKPHPRSYGAVAEFFRLNRMHRFCSTEMAVRRVTGLAADMLGMQDRGYIRKGYAADITVFDPDTIAPRATYLNPVQLAEGVEYVLIGGKAALEKGRQTALRNGEFLRKRRA